MSAGSSKYAGLPDIEEGAPDVFESPDVPADLNYEPEEDSDSELHAPVMAPQRSNSSEDIVGERLAVDSARKRFKDANVNGDADFSTSLTAKRRKQPPMYPHQLPDTSIYEYMPRGYSTASGQPVASTSETPLQRLRRLRIEVEEVEAQLQAEKSQAATDAQVESAQKEAEVPTGALLAQLRYLRNNLTRLTPEAEEVESSVKAQEPTDEVLRRLGSPLPPVEATPSTRPSGIQPEMPAETDLDERLVRLERFLGAQEAEFNESTSMPPPLINTLAKLEHQLQLLTQPRHLDTVARRVKTLVGDLERMHDARRKLGDTRPLNVALSSGITVVTPGTSGDPTPAAPQIIRSEGEDLPPDALQKIDALFAMLPRIEPLIPLAPQLLTRLKTLAPLHATAADFAASLTDVQREATGLKEAEVALREALEGLSRSVESNEQVVRGNLESLQQRVEAVSKRMEALQA